MPPSNSAAKAKQTKSAPAKGQSQSRQRRAAAPKTFSRDESDSDENSNDNDDAEHTDGEGDEDEQLQEDEEADDEEEEDSSAMFLKMFDAIRKNAAKIKGNPRATRQKDLNGKSEKYRREAESFVEEGNAYIDDLLASASLLRSENKNATKTRAMQMQSAGEGLWIDASVSMKTALELSVGDIAGRRVDEINDACRRIALQPERRAKSLRGLKRTVREEVAGVVEHEQVASDAEVLIRNYKAMLRSR